MMTVIVHIVVAFAPAPDDGRRTTLYSYGFQKRYTVVITQAAVDKAPIWKDDADNPPLSARKAMKLAGTKKDALVKDNDDWKWQRNSAELVEMYEGRWYWLITFEAHVWQGGTTGQPPNLRLVVLMDGTVIEPEVATVKKDR